MKIIHNNPFRILGIISNASAKEILEAETYIQRYLEIKKVAELKFDISPPLEKINRTSNTIVNAKNQIHDNCEKLNHSLFWFVNGTSIDKIALKKLSESKDIKLAADTFLKGCKDFKLTKSTFSAILNFTTIELLSYINHQDEKRFSEAIKHKYDIINNKEVFKTFENLITGSIEKINQNDLKEKFIENVKILLSETFLNKNHNDILLNIFSEEKSLFNKIKEDIISNLTEEIKKIHEVFESFLSKQSKKTDNQIIKSKSIILQNAKSLINDTKFLLNQLKKEIGDKSFQYTNLVNDIFTSVNAAVILSYNKEVKTNSNIDCKIYIKLLDQCIDELKNLNCSIKQTIVKNLSVIKNDESSSNCQFCNSGKIGNYTLKVEMHQMTGAYQYTYFKDGGLKISCCFSCIAKRIPLKLIAFLLAPLWWPIVFIIAALIRQYKNSWYGWLYRFIYKNLFGLSVRNHPTIKNYINQGYKIGLP